MRLKSIKLAGFKSFVDPTSVHFPSNMSAVVGPNGCGKSNIIDAVRWVMGESSAKTLRGESMTDVIFNGTTNRQPVGQASIELVFDNTDGKITGEYAAYAEISVRRLVSREGQSEYYLNGSKCRRRDITDLFLGTGLGPRSYAIIEQGMISRLIESRPEDLRVFIEEAAGISKYKERRRETENRMRRTTENLERLTDLREELERQLAHLQRQAQAAERYSEYKAEERSLRAELLALQWQGFKGDLERHQNEIGEREVKHGALSAEHESVMTSIEEWRIKHTDLTDEFNAVQADYYTVGGEVTRVEQALKFAQESRARIESELAQTQTSLAETRQHLETDRERLALWQEELAEQEPALEKARTESEMAAAQLAESEQAMAQWQARWDEFNQRAAGPTRASEVQQSRILYLEQVLSRLQQRLTRLEEEKQSLATGQEGGDLDALALEVQEAAEAVTVQEQAVDAAKARIHDSRGQLDTLRQQQDTQRSRLQQLRGQESSLEALQDAARKGDSASDRDQWLNNDQLQARGPLFENLSVDDGWAPAVEQVLSGALTASRIGGYQQGLNALSGEAPDGLYLVDASASEVAAVPGTLAAVTQGAGPLQAKLTQVFTADSLSAALEQLPSLASGQSIITQEGVWLGQGWARTRQGGDSAAGVIEREAELVRVREEIEQVLAQSESTDEALAALREALVEAEESLSVAQAAQQQASRAHSDLLAEQKTRIAASEQLRQRRERLDADIAEARGQFETEQESLATARAELAEALDQMAIDGEERERLNAERESHREAVAANRQRARDLRDASHQYDMRVQNLRTQLRTVGDTITRLERQLASLADRERELNEQLPGDDDPDAALRDELSTLLASRVEAEQKLTAARQTVTNAEHELREAEKRRVALEHQMQAVHSEMESRRLTIAECNVRIENVERQLTELEAEPAAVVASIPEEANEAEWQVKVERVAARIQRLGPINLAAIEECARASERKQYLDAQNEDLVSALETLENAIRKIDKETRNRFRETFDQINSGFAELFPRVFGGGTACLEMTGDDLLDTGVAIMARPPGKKNSTIHLLSGGEKAMTAIALVFSIFQLNPAPFCMLDEVDAPLDDANVGRYARMVKEMSEKVQFIFITHNKITMEAADQLMGVTMHEPGVSRLVTVDIDAAAQLAAS
jgi:chromosome segregation protein